MSASGRERTRTPAPEPDLQPIGGALRAKPGSRDEEGGSRLRKRATAGGGWRAPELSEGTWSPGEPAFHVPSPSPGWTWPLRVRPRLGAGGANPSHGLADACRSLVRRRSHGVAAMDVQRSRPGSSMARRTPLAKPWSCRLVRLRERPVQSAGPTRLEPRLSPDFRAAVSLGPLTFRRKPLSGKRPKTGGCAQPPPAQWASLCISVGGQVFRSTDQRFAAVHRNTRSYPVSAAFFSSSASQSSSAAVRSARAASAAFMCRSNALGSRAYSSGSASA